jgi:hypothetical protein
MGVQASRLRDWGPYRRWNLKQVGMSLLAVRASPARTGSATS